MGFGCERVSNDAAEAAFLAVGSQMDDIFAIGKVLALSLSDEQLLFDAGWGVAFDKNHVFAIAGLIFIIEIGLHYGAVEV